MKREVERRRRSGDVNQWVDKRDLGEKVHIWLAGCCRLPLYKKQRKTMLRLSGALDAAMIPSSKWRMKE
jgi:hypothetical protein